MSFWNSLSQMVSDAGTSISSVGDSARKLVGRGEEPGENEAENDDSLEKSRSVNPPRPGCPLVVPDTTNDGSNNKGVEGTPNTFFPRLYGTPNFLKRVSTDTMTPQASLDQENPNTHRTGSFKAHAQKFFGTHGLTQGGETGSLDSSNVSTDRFQIGKSSTISDNRSSSGAMEDFPGRRKGMSVKKGSKNSTKVSKPNCFMEMPQRWAEVTDTRSG